MGFWDRLFSVDDEEEYEDEYNTAEEQNEEPEEEEKPAFKGGFFSGRSAARSTEQENTSGQMQVVLIKPERYDDGTIIADHLNQNKTVVINLENADREVCRRLLDFLSGAAYIRKGNIKKVSKSTYIVTPNKVNVMGDMMADEYETSEMMF